MGTGFTPADGQQALIRVMESGLDVLSELGSRGTSYNHNTIRQFQLLWNQDRALVVMVYPRLGIINKVSVDGIWGTQTATVITTLYGVGAPGGIAPMPASIGALQTWWRANQAMVSGYLARTRAAMVTAAASSGATTGGSTAAAATTALPSGAPGAVTSGTARGDAAVAAGRVDTPDARAGGAIVMLPGSEIVGTVPTGRKFPWQWVVVGVAVAGFAGLVGWFAWKKHKRGGRRVAV